MLAVGASVFYAAYLLTAHRARARVDLLTVVTLSTLVSIVALLVINLAMGTTLVGYSRSAWLALAGLGLVSQLGGWLCINYALGHLRAAPVSVCLLAQVVVTALVAIPVLGELVHTNQVVGGILVLAGIFLVIQGTGREELPLPE
jgi:drug/metabolite transporter (DMT)-like permease